MSKQELIGVQVAVEYYVLTRMAGTVTVLVPPEAIGDPVELLSALGEDDEWRRQQLTQTAVDTDENLKAEFVRLATPAEMWDMPGVDEYDYEPPTLLATLDIDWRETDDTGNWDMDGRATIDVPFAVLAGRDTDLVAWLDRNMDAWISEAMEAMDQDEFPEDVDEQVVTGATVLTVAECANSLDQDKAAAFVWEETAEAKIGRPNLLSGGWYMTSMGITPEQWTRWARFPRNGAEDA